MKDYRQNDLMFKKFSNKTTNKKDFYDKTLSSFFNLIYLLLKQKKFNFWLESISVFIQLFQFLSFSFNPSVK